MQEKLAKQSQKLSDLVKAVKKEGAKGDSSPLVDGAAAAKTAEDMKNKFTGLLKSKQTSEGNSEEVQDKSKELAGKLTAGKDAVAGFFSKEKSPVGSKGDENDNPEDKSKLPVDTEKLKDAVQTGMGAMDGLKGKLLKTVTPKGEKDSETSNDPNKDSSQTPADGSTTLTGAAENAKGAVIKGLGAAAAAASGLKTTNTSPQQQSATEQ